MYHLILDTRYGVSSFVLVPIKKVDKIVTKIIIGFPDVIWTYAISCGRGVRYKQITLRSLAMTSFWHFFVVVNGVINIS